VVLSPDARPLVSILTPSFNQGRWLPDNLRSVACQTYPNIEHIVMDGGSTDGSVELLEQADPAVIWRSEPDDGQTQAINKAFAQSTGEIIGWINSDDAYFDCRAVESAVAYFETHPGVDVVYGHAAKVSAEGTVISIVWAVPFSYRFLRRLDFLVQPAMFIRRRALESGFLDESFHFAMDWELWLRLARERKFGRMRRVLAIDRVQPDRKIKTWLDVLEQDCERLGEMCGVGGPWYRYPWTVRAYNWVARIGGAVAMARMPRQLAFSGRQDPLGRRLMRQVLLPKSMWPEEYR